MNVLSNPLPLDRGEVLLAKAGQARSVDLRVTADHVVHAGSEHAAGAVEPPLRRFVAALDEHRSGLQREVSKRVVLKYMPHFHFHLDESIERGVASRSMRRQSR